VDDALPTPRSIPQGYAAWCRACQHTVRLDLPALVAGGHGDVPLIHLPLRCSCDSDKFGIIVGAVSAGKWQPAPPQPAMGARHDCCGGPRVGGQLLIGIEGASSRLMLRIVLRDG
jgi:hypothetical protein